MTDPAHRLVIVGAGIAGIRTAESARAAGYDGIVTLIGDEEHLPYERPPLSKQVLAGAWDKSAVFPRSPEEIAAANIDLRLGVRALALDRSRRQIKLNDGSTMGYDTLVIATGARARRLPFDQPDGVYTIRTLNDSLEIAEHLRSRPRVVVVGAGFIGLEVASTARAAGCQVTLIESGRVPLVRALGQTMGVHCAALHEANGVEVLTRGRVEGFTARDRAVTGVVLDVGVLPADLVVVGIGAIPNTEWLAGSGLRVDDGVLCDEDGRVDETGTIYALGDVAGWWDARVDRHRRHEHWTSASEQAAHVGRLIAGRDASTHQPIPYFWSDQHGIKIQMAGTAAEADDLILLEGSLASGRFVAAYTEGEQLNAVLAFDSPRSFAMHRGLLTRGGTLADAQDLAERNESARATVAR